MNATNWQTLWPIQSGSSANWRMLTPRRLTQHDRQLKIYLKLGDFFQLSISKCTANVSIPRQDHFNLFHTLIWYSIHKILSQRPSVGAKYSSLTVSAQQYTAKACISWRWWTTAFVMLWSSISDMKRPSSVFHTTSLIASLHCGLHRTERTIWTVFTCIYVLKDMQIKPELHHTIAERKADLKTNIRFLFYLTEWASWWLMLQHSHACVSSWVLYRSL